MYVRNPLTQEDKSASEVFNNTGSQVQGYFVAVQALPNSTPATNSGLVIYEKHASIRILAYYYPSDGGVAGLSIECFDSQTAQIIGVRLV